AAKHRLVERMSRKLFGRSKQDFPGIFGHAVLYPFGRVLGPLPTSTEPNLLFAYADMPKLQEKLVCAFAAWGRPERGELFTSAICAAVERFLSEATDFVPVLAAQVDEDERRITDLTRRQYTAFRGILGAKRVHVRGTSGSGKTLLACWAAQSFARERQK